MDLRDKSGNTEQEFLAAYRQEDYPRPSVATDIAIFTLSNTPEENYRKLPEQELRLLLVRRGGHPYLGQWALPGGFVRPNETVHEAACRALFKETGVDGGYLEQLYTFSEPGRDPRAWVLSCAHMALLDSQNICIRAGDDTSDAAWFRIAYTPVARSTTPEGEAAQQYRLELSGENTLLHATVSSPAGRPDAELEVLENTGFAFDHAKMIALAMMRLRNKVEYTDLAFNLMPEKFTLTQLQQVYEVILGKPLLKAAFRRKIAGLVQETGDYTQHAGHRPSQLFCRRENGWLR